MDSKYMKITEKLISSGNDINGASTLLRNYLTQNGFSGKEYIIDEFRRQFPYAFVNFDSLCLKSARNIVYKAGEDESLMREAIELLSGMAINNDIQSQLLLADILINKLSMPSDAQIKAGMEWLHKAANDSNEVNMDPSYDGNSLAQIRLAQIYHYGNSVIESDLERAIEYYTMALKSYRSAALGIADIYIYKADVDISYLKKAEELLLNNLSTYEPGIYLLLADVQAEMKKYNEAAINYGDFLNNNMVRTDSMRYDYQIKQVLGYLIQWSELEFVEAHYQLAKYYEIDSEHNILSDVYYQKAALGGNAMAIKKFNSMNSNSKSKKIN